MNMGIISLFFNGEGFALYILVGFFLTVMRLTLSSHIRTTIWLLCVFPESWSWDYSHGLGIKVSWNSVLGWPLCQYICYMVVG
jgi:hypothetical protein